MLYCVSALGAQGSYEFITEGEKDFPQKAAEGFAAGGITFTDVEGSFVVLTNANLIGLSIKQVEAKKENPPQG